MDPATDRALQALTDALVELGKIIVQVGVALAAAFKAFTVAVNLVLATYAAQAQGRDLNDEWRHFAPMWSKSD